MTKTFKNIFLINRWPECFDIWHGASLGQGDSAPVPRVPNAPLSVYCFI